MKESLSAFLRRRSKKKTATLKYISLLRRVQKFLVFSLKDCYRVDLLEI